MNVSYLLVEDDELFRNSLARALRRRGDEVFCAASADEAGRLMTTHRPQRVVLDLNLGGDNGLRVLSELRAIEPAVQVVMLTGYASVASTVEAMKRGAENYLCKPARVSDILAAFASDKDSPDVEVSADEALSAAPLSVERLTWEHIQRILAENDGNISATARALNMHRRTLQRKLQKRPVAR